jgi:hypothetical protein
MIISNYRENITLLNILLLFFLTYILIFKIFLNIENEDYCHGWKFNSYF